MAGYTKIAPEGSGEYNITKENFAKINDGVYDLKHMILNIKDYGAIGNGDPANAAADTAALQAAVNDLPAGGGMIYAPPGDYRINASITFPTGNIVSGYYESPVTIMGAGPQATKFRRTSDVTIIDASGSISAGTVTMRRTVSLENLQLDGNNTGTTPLMRCFYNLLSKHYNVWFCNTLGNAVRGVQWWDSQFVNCWFFSCRGTTLSLDPSWNSGTGIWGNEAVVLTSVGASGLTSSQMGYSTDNVNNIWFVNCNFTENCAGDIYIGQMGGSSQPNKCFFVNTKYECLNGAVGPRIRVYTGAYLSFQNMHLLVNGYGTGIGSVDLINLTNCGRSAFQNVLLDQGSVPVARGIHVHGGSNQNLFDQITSNLNTGGTGTAPEAASLTAIYGQYTTASGQYGADKVFGFEGTSSGNRIGKVNLVGSLGYLHDNNSVGYEFNAKGGVSTQTPGAVTTVNIAHGLGTAPQGVSVEPNNANARGAPSMHVTFDATNIILNFSAALTAATSYQWTWLAL